VSLIYWDTMLFIYWLEMNPSHAKQVEKIYSRMEERGDQLCTSVFTLGEVLTGTYKTAGADEVQKIRDYFESPAIRLLPFNTDVADRYAKIRVRWRVSPADAIHLASAAVAGTDLYISNDASLKKLSIEGISFIAGLDAALL
jgi:uncharacterized protein